MWKRGRRLFSTAAVLMLLTALAHTAGNLAPESGDAAEARLLADMRGYRIPLGMSMQPSMWDVYRSLVFTMSVTLLALGVLNLLLAAGADTPPGLLRRVSWLNAVWAGALIALSWRYQLPPPIISFVLVEVAVVGAIFTSKTAP